MSTWTIEHRNLVALLTFSRPPENLMDSASMIELGELLEYCALVTDFNGIVTGRPAMMSSPVSRMNRTGWRHSRARIS